MLFLYSMTWRMYEFSDTALSLLKKLLIVPSLCLIRACWENMAVLFELYELVDETCKNNKITDEVDNTLMRLLLSNRFEPDNRFIPLEVLKSSVPYRAKNIISLIKRVEKTYPDAKDFYSNLCEFVHPNGDGVVGSYSKLNREIDRTDFGPHLSENVSLYEAFLNTLSVSVSLFIDFEVRVEEMIPSFSKLCEDFLLSRTD